MNKWFLSSTGSGDLSLTIKGILVGIIPTAIIVLHAFGFTISTEDLTQGVELLTAAISAAITFAGLTRKLYYWGNNIWTTYIKPRITK